MRNDNSFTTTASFVVVLGCVALAGCTAPTPPATPYDPNEAQNRQIHELNADLDRYAIRPASEAVGVVTDRPLRTALRNASDNWDIPGDVANNLLQFRIDKAVTNTLRFGINSTAGIFGVLDPASEIGLTGDPTDFGETLHIWGVGEGAYGELPALGPTTERDTAGLIVDIAINPLSYMFPGTTLFFIGLDGAALLAKRKEYSETIDSVLYDSADSYAQTRLLYLQNRRYELGQAPSDDSFVDPYEDPYAE